MTACAARLKFADVEKTKLVTATSELGRNMLIHGGGGAMTLTELARDGRAGIELCFSDQGPGIPDIEQAMRDGFSTGTSLGLGLGGARRLVSEFNIESAIAQGTKVTVIQWKRR